MAGETERCWVKSADRLKCHRSQQQRMKKQKRFGKRKRPEAESPDLNTMSAEELLSYALRALADRRRVAKGIKRTDGRKRQRKI
jgi:hypothetical protein